MTAIQRQLEQLQQIDPGCRVDLMNAFQECRAGTAALGLKKMIDGFEIYCNAFAKEFDSKIADSHVFGPACIDVANALREFLNGPGKFDGGTLDRAICEIADKGGFLEDIT